VIDQDISRYLASTKEF